MPRLALVSALLVALLRGAPSAAAQIPPAADAPSIVTSGEAILQLPPDRAFVQIGAEGRAQKPADAQQSSANAMTAVQTAVKNLGLAADAIKTTSYTLQPEYDYQNGRQLLRGYVARNVIDVRVDDLAKLGRVLDVAGTAGAATITGLRWDLKNRDAVELDALRLAVKDATDRAQAMAAAAGRALGPIIRLQEQSMSVPRPVMGVSAALAARESVSTPIEAGHIEVRAQVSLTVAIK